MNAEVIKKFKESGAISAKVLLFGSKMIKPGVKIIDVCDAVEEKIRALGGQPAFPAQVSRNEIAAHYCPEQDDETTFQEGDIVKLDCGTHVDGYVSDNAISVNLGDFEELVKASKDALNAAVKMAKPGTRTSEIGRAIQEQIEKYNFSPVKNLSGHGIGLYTVHASPSIPNFDNKVSEVLKEGQSIAIEPFASNGAGLIHEKGEPTVFMQQTRKPIRSQFARDLLKDIDAYNGLPFTTRWLSRKHGVGKTRFGLRELINAGIIKGYPSLPDIQKGFISQAEHSVLVFDKPIIITKIDD
ncbi:MAG: type II methionyl aminopeptidase [Nanoarchaeota archaeon]|nr:type II methionyl aminopeptidase [Nanoarchaeota archaeon]MBU1269750.1 type II methionyl aminopeptidase [Nanoarchaeota archaeon]MBU1604128.1 type II methionyl aminopeptidase [Nanoarchaeota archaeon]MBU2443921.1 type II methionyl aminopeptidase [Nanoarchaeota archaeon]